MWALRIAHSYWLALTGSHIVFVCVTYCCSLLREYDRSDDTYAPNYACFIRPFFVSNWDRAQSLVSEDGSRRGSLLCYTPIAPAQAQRRRVHEDAFNLLIELFHLQLRLEKETAEWLCHKLAFELGGVRCQCGSSCCARCVSLPPAAFKPPLATRRRHRAAGTQQMRAPGGGGYRKCWRTERICAIPCDLAQEGCSEGGLPSLQRHSRYHRVCRWHTYCHQGAAGHCCA